jgi:hypothetical protein
MPQEGLEPWIPVTTRSLFSVISYRRRLRDEFQRNSELCKIWGFHGGDYDDYHLPEDDNHQIQNYFPQLLHIF